MNLVDLQARHDALVCEIKEQIKWERELIVAAHQVRSTINSMLIEQKKLDREIFMETRGITKVGRKSSNKEKETKRLMSLEEMMDNLTPEMCAILAERFGEQQK